MKPLIRHPAKLGAGLAIATLPLHAILSEEASRGFAAVLLALVAGIYIGFAMRDGRASALATEIVVAAGFIGAAIIGLWSTAWAIPAAYVLHGLWDVAHHHWIDTAMPRWYVPFCAVFDWMFAAGLAAIWLLN